MAEEPREKTFHRVIISDARDMREMENESVHLVITSPPYWHIKDYGTPGQIGFGQSYEDYINDLNLVWAEAARVLKPGCKLAVNIGDQFARASEYGHYAVIPIRTEIIRFMLAAGFLHMGTIIWQKKTTMRTSGGATVMGSYPYPRNGILEIDYEFIMIFKKPGKPPRVPRQIKQKARLSKHEWKKLFSGHWYIKPERQKGHAAMFPGELPARLIRMFSFPGETVLDPFLGSGTTSLAAARLGRNSVGYEVNPAFVPIIEQKLGDIEGFGAELRIVRPETRPFDRARALSRLPYVFHDPQGLRRLSEFKAPEQDLFGVKEILGPTELVLSDGRKIMLIGIKENPEKRAEAMEFLRNKTQGQRVFFKTDPAQPAGDGALPVYLYLRNRTHLNAHLIKRGLARVDEAQDFKHKARFLRYQEEALTKEDKNKHVQDNTGIDGPF